MSEPIQAKYIDTLKVSGVAKLERMPDKCPQCHHFIEPNKFEGFLSNTGDKLDIVFRCTRNYCQNVFIGYYYCVDKYSCLYRLSRVAPVNYSEKKFSEVIEEITPDFCKIYNEAKKAESIGLDQICGAGYRKSLEFLVKDYLIRQAAEEKEQEKIKKEFLSKCIKDRIENKNIKKVAERASWLGNDETHYLRKWEGKEIKDLKTLIKLTVYWVESELTTQQFESDMPEGKK